ncbi:hypothetical protein [Halothermothrix orenii]|uniref:HTH luxR-type domain-containing protein n=1 Tax=Halothermothrix orenii (strain H 168 / OCM 544 / DSM 9562) TaxID=373903 RepID=B8CZT3_HALOH|nr:hypothetical protein [Halothermothrix orenii]ACL70785.1 hypothetical protein Hore_20400 [Halothermothrix orenii H 168]
MVLKNTTGENPNLTQYEKIDQHEFLVAWSMGMNDEEIAKKLGVSVPLVKEFKASLFSNN